tara:strand:+ start:10381 stop:10914 length:534 start_codon:yes stop_codon:yes gene_type:complete
MNQSEQLLREFFTALGSPEYGYLMLEPMFIYGIGLGLIIFLFALIVKEPKSQMLGLILIAGCAMMIGPYLNRRGAAEARIVQVYQIDQPDRAEGFIAKTKNRRNAKWLYYLTAAVAIGALLVGGKNKVGTGLTIATILLAVGTIFFSSVFHYNEAKLYHPNLRAPPASMQYSSDTLR